MQSTLQLGSEDTLRALNAAAEQAVALAKPVSLAICDPSGLLICFHRLGNPPPLTVAIAQSKAATAALSRRATGAWEESIAARPALAQLPGVLGVLGGLPVMADGHCLGGIGVAGASSEEDEAIAAAALAAMLLSASPAT